MREITHLLHAMRDGDEAAGRQLAPLVYDELLSLARGRLSGLSPARTIQTHDLVHEAWLKLAGPGEWENRRHFFGAAARAMRNLLVDDARRRGRDKHGGQLERVTLNRAVTDASEESLLDVVALDAALARLEQDDPLKSEIVMLRYFSGLTIDETAEVLGVSSATVDRHWSFARAWLRRELQSD